MSWAEKIRARLLPRAAMGPQAFADWLAGQTRAAFWIDARDSRVEPRPYDKYALYRRWAAGG